MGAAVSPEGVGGVPPTIDRLRLFRFGMSLAYEVAALVAIAAAAAEAAAAAGDPTDRLATDLGLFVGINTRFGGPGGAAAAAAVVDGVAVPPVR